MGEVGQFWVAERLRSQKWEVKGQSSAPEMDGVRNIYIKIYKKNIYKKI